MQARLYEALSGADEGDAAERRNFFLHAASLTMTKVADGLIDPKIVLSWLMTALGAPAAMVGFLVPIREAGALAPQLLIAPFVRGAAIRKTFWAFGSLGQGLCALVIAAAALFLTGAAAGAVILAALGALALCRAVCSTSYKDVLGKTVQKSTRGAATGVASSLAASGTMLFGALIALDVIPRTVTAISCVVAVAGVVWLVSGLLFLRVHEEPSETEDGEAFALSCLVSPLWDDPQLRRFIAARALLVPTALAPPFLIALAAQSGEDAGGALGPFILASALASVLSGYIWGRMSDASSRKTFIASGGLSAVALGIGAGIAAVMQPGLWVVVALLFVAQIGYEGVRSARKIHLVDMADETQRAVYTALSNTLIGGVLIAGGVLGVIAQFYGLSVTLATSAALCLAGIAVAFGLEEVQQS